MNKEAIEIFEATQRQQLKTTPTRYDQVPDGNYKGKVYITFDKVKSKKSENYLRDKYKIKLTIQAGKFAGKDVYLHRVIFPTFLGNKPPKDKEEELKKWEMKSIKYMLDTNKILETCGVRLESVTAKELPHKIAANNRQESIVEFKIRDGIPYINQFIEQKPDPKPELAFGGSTNSKGNIETPW